MFDEGRRKNNKRRNNMNVKFKTFCAIALSVLLCFGMLLLPACATAGQGDLPSEEEIVSPLPDGVTDGATDEDEESDGQQQPSADGNDQSSGGGQSGGGSQNGGGGQNNGGTVVTPEQQSKVGYIAVIGANVNVRAGAGTDYSVLGQAKQSTLFAVVGKIGNWYITYYKNTLGYIWSDYCKTVYMTASTDSRVEKVISDATKLLGVKYVYGAVRYHDGSGNRLSGFSVYAFDCSSLLQYAFKTGANYNLQVTTRTQVKQGKTVSSSQLKRGDLMFFTNASCYNNTGVERIGHVALYLGDNYILHTSSQFAKIEKISASRWSYYVQSQRIF